jgi:hypothetical protein
VTSIEKESKSLSLETPSLSDLPLKKLFPFKSRTLLLPTLRSVRQTLNMKLQTGPHSKFIRSTTSVLSDMPSVYLSDACLIEDPHWEEVINQSNTIPLQLRKSSDGYSLIQDKARSDDAFTEPPLSDILLILVAQEWLLTLLAILLLYSQLLSMVWSVLYGTPYSLEKTLFGVIWGSIPLIVHSTRTLPLSTVWMIWLVMGFQVMMHHLLSAGRQLASVPEFS